jgi:acyl dehydratase
VVLTVNGIPEIMALAGRDLGHPGWREITQELIDAFAEVSGDISGSTPMSSARRPDHRQRLPDAELGDPPVRRVAKGRPCRHDTELRGRQVPFPVPVPVGSRVRLHASIADVGEVGKGGVQVVRAFTFEIEGSDKPARVAESLTRYYP